MAQQPAPIRIVSNQMFLEDLAPPPEGTPPEMMYDDPVYASEVPPEEGEGLEKPGNPDPPLGEPSGFWVISDGGDPAQYWQDSNQTWVESVTEASMYNDEGKAAETLPTDPPTALWVDRATVVEP